MSERPQNASALNEIRNGSPRATNARCFYINHAYSNQSYTKLTYAYKTYNIKDVWSHDHTPLKLYAHVTIQ